MLLDLLRVLQVDQHRRGIPEGLDAADDFAGGVRIGGRRYLIGMRRPSLAWAYTMTGTWVTAP